MANEPRRPGRPPVDPRDTSVGVHVRLSSRDYDKAYTRAQQAGVSVPEILRRDLERAKPK